MKRPEVLDQDVVVVPAKADGGMQRSGTEAIDEIEEILNLSPGNIYDARSSHCYSAMLPASPYTSAWAEVKAYVDGLEKRNNVLSGALELSAGPLSIAALTARSEAAEARLKEAELVIAPFANASDEADALTGHDGLTGQFIDLPHLRAARTWMEGK